MFNTKTTRPNGTSKGAEALLVAMALWVGIGLASTSSAEPYFEFTPHGTLGEQGKRRVKLMRFDPTRPMTQLESDEAPDYSDLGIRAEVDLRANQSTVKNQGERGSCAYFAATALVEHSYKQFFSYEKEVNLSEEYLIYYAKDVLGYSSRNDGSFVAQNLKAIRSGGMLLEEAMPYTENWFASGMPCESYAGQEASAPTYCFAHHKPDDSVLESESAIGVDEYDLELTRVGDDMRKVLRSLDQGMPVSVSIPLHNDGWANDQEPVFYNEELDQACRETEEPDLCGGHAVVLVGYDLQQRTFWFKNSWGDDWGHAGYGLMGFDYVERWAYTEGFWQTQFSRFDRHDLIHQPVSYGVNDVGYQLVESTDASGEAVYAVDLSYDFQGPLGSFYYVSLFAMTKDEAGEYQVIQVQQGDKTDFLAERFYKVALEEADLRRDAQNPLRLGIARKHLTPFLEAGTEVFLRASIYSMSDQKKYDVLFREFLNVPATQVVPEPSPAPIPDAS